MRPEGFSFVFQGLFSNNRFGKLRKITKVHVLHYPVGAQALSCLQLSGYMWHILGSLACVRCLSPCGSLQWSALAPEQHSPAATSLYSLLTGSVRSSLALEKWQQHLSGAERPNKITDVCQHSLCFLLGVPLLIALRMGFVICTL